MRTFQHWRDLCVIRAQIPQYSSSSNLVMASSYMPIEDDPLPHDLTRLVNYCEEEGLDLIIGTDSNEHHTLWGMDTSNIKDSLICRGCLEVAEIAAHVIMVCRGVAAYRAKHLRNSGSLSEAATRIKKLLAFFAELEWLEDHRLELTFEASFVDYNKHAETRTRFQFLEKNHPSTS